MMNMRNRSASNAVSHLLTQNPCLLISGARQTGKTVLARQVLPEAPIFDLERDRDYDRIAYDCDFFLDGLQGAVILKEVQHLPQLFPALKTAAGKGLGPYLLTTSGSPHVLKQLEDVFGVDGFGVFELGGFHLEEVWPCEPSYFYEMVLNRNAQDLFSLIPEKRTEDLFSSCLRGSLPTSFLDVEGASVWLEDYYRNYTDRDLQTWWPGLKTRVFRTFLKMLASSSGHTQNASNLARSLDITTPTVQKYTAMAETLFLWRRIPCWRDSGGKRIVKMARGHLRDMGLLNMALGIGNEETLRSHVNLNAVWRSFITEEILKGFTSRLIPVKYYYYKTHNQAEVDLVLEGDFGVLPIDIKLGFKTEPGKIRALNAFVRDFGCKFGLVINNGDCVRRITPNVIQIPATCL